MTPLEEIKSKLDIVEVIGSYLELTPASGNHRARCPFHNEKTPSFMVSKEKQIWHCFGCDRGGDMISFVQEHEGVDFQGALKILAEKAGVQLGAWQGKKQDNTRLYEVNQRACEFYQANLKSEGEVVDKVQAYLKKRKVSQESIDKWQLGLSGEGWDELLKHLLSNKYTEKEIFDAGLIVRKKDGSGYVDRFRKRLMFPIHDNQGRVVAFTSRTLNGIAYQEEDFGGKYINSPQTVIYDKSQTLYGWYLAKNDIRHKKYLIIVEGNMDAIAASQAGSENVVAVSGTALTESHLKLIKRYTDNVVLAFDGDAAGSRAVFRSISLAWKQDMNIKILVLPKGKDPADMISENKEGWAEAIKKSEPVMDYYVRRVLGAIDINRADHKKIAVKKLLPIIKYLSSKVEQIHYLNILSDRLNVPINVLEEMLSQANPFLESKEEVPSEEVKLSSSSPEQKISEQLLALAFYNKKFLDKLLKEIDPEAISDNLRSLYKQTIIHYTKHQNLESFIEEADLSQKDKDEYIKLSLLIENQKSDITNHEAEGDFNRYLAHIKQKHLQTNRSQLINDLRKAEMEGNQEEQDNISHKINLLNKELQKNKP